MRTYIDKYCDEAARYTAEFELRDFKIVDRGVTRVSISCFAPTRAQAIRDLKRTLKAVIEEMQKELA